MQSITIEDLFSEMGYSYDSLDVDIPVNVENLGYEVLTLGQDGQNAWCAIKTIVRKHSVNAYSVPEFDLTISPLHKFWAKIKNSEPHWVEAFALSECDGVELFHQDHGWISASVIKNNHVTDILDIEVADQHSYFSNGLLSHNTMHGDPLVTPGGNAIPYHASVRIRLGSGAKVKDKDGNAIGIHVTVNVPKNKVAQPFRHAEMDILFGRGMVEHEYLFDVLRTWSEKNGPAKKNGKSIELDGSGAWKRLAITDDKTGELIEKKFYKNEFADLMVDPQYKPYIDDLCEAALVIDTSNSQIDGTLDSGGEG